MKYLSFRTMKVFFVEFEIAIISGMVIKLIGWIFEIYMRTGGTLNWTLFTHACYKRRSPQLLKTIESDGKSISDMQGNIIREISSYKPIES